MNRRTAADAGANRRTAADAGANRRTAADAGANRRTAADAGANRWTADAAMKRRAAAALLVLAALTGCGIQETDVVEAGGAATVIVGPIPEDRVVLYFLGPDGRSMPVAREIGLPDSFPTSSSDGSGASREPSDLFGPDYDISRDDLRRAQGTTDKILAMLLAGPRDNEAEAGITTALPGSEAGGPHVVPDPNATTSARRLFRLRTPFPVHDLSEAAVRQLVCTTAYAEHPAGLVDVSVSGPDGVLTTARCDE